MNRHQKSAAPAAERSPIAGVVWGLVFSLPLWASVYALGWLITEAVKF